MKHDLQKTIESVFANIRLDEGISVIYDFLKLVYLNEGISVKRLSNELFLPVPVVSAIKNEFKKHSFITAANGVRLTGAGERFVMEDMGYKAIDKDALSKVMSDEDICAGRYEDILSDLNDIHQNRPSVDVTVDQSLGTAKTGLKRAQLMLKNGSLIGKKVLFIGDDDLTSIALILMLQSISVNGNASGAADITVLDIDERILSFIHSVSSVKGFHVSCVAHDVRKPLSDDLTHCFDCVVTDPPYTVEGLSLFLSRGAAALKNEPSLALYLSFGRKSQEIMLSAQRHIIDSGFVLSRIYPRFNEYHGAQIIGGVSDVMILNTTTRVRQLVVGDYEGPLYTNELNRVSRVYECKNCRARYTVGHDEAFITIESLKETGCTCGENTFILVKRKRPAAKE